MKKCLVFSFAALAILLQSCANGQTQNSPGSLSANEFARKIKEIPSAPVIDVRTSDEFSKGHLKNAKNIDWNGNDFDKQIEAFDKSKPVFVYCLSGARSTSAADKMRSEGFKEVYQLNGGMMKWRAANLPETTSNEPASPGMSMLQFDALINPDKLVLVDFYADWCTPCKKMKPYLDEISKDMSGKVAVIRINADENPSLCKEFKIDALPVLQLYKNKALIWTQKGYIDKEGVMKQLQ